MKTFLIVSGIVLGVLLLSFIALLLLMKTNGKRRRDMQKYKGVRFAHRGLHGEGRAENSMSAFRAAVERGYGIELDVRLSRDGELVVFHDDTLLRVCGADARVDSKTLAELREYRLSGTEETVPTFREVLELVDGRVPLLVELKEDAYRYGVTEKTVMMLREYKGDFIVESFNPLALGRFRELMPEAMRGILSHNYFKDKKYRKPMYFILQNLLLNFKAKPDFIAFCHTDYKNAAFRLVKFFFRPYTTAWTVKSREEESCALTHGFDGVIFEGYIPEETGDAI